MKWNMSKKMLAEYYFQDKNKRKKEKPHHRITFVTPLYYLKHGIDEKEEKIIIAASVLSDPHTPETQH